MTADPSLAQPTLEVPPDHILVLNRWVVPIIVPGCMRGRNVQLEDNNGNSIGNPYTEYLVPLVEQGQLLLADWRPLSRPRHAIAYFSIQTPELPCVDPPDKYYRYWYRAMGILEFNFLMTHNAVQDVFQGQVGIASEHLYIYNPAASQGFKKQKSYYSTGKYRVMVRFDMGDRSEETRVDVYAKRKAEGWTAKDGANHAVGLGTASGNVGAMDWFNQKIKRGFIKYEAIKFWVECPMTGKQAQTEWDALDNLPPMEPLTYKKYIKSVHDNELNSVSLNEMLTSHSHSHKAHQEYADYEYDYDFVKSEMLPIGYNDY
eukprot:437648_1